MLIDDSI